MVELLLLPKKRNKGCVKEQKRRWRKKHPDLKQAENGRWVKRYPEKARADRIARYYVELAKFCELCPNDDVRFAELRHHPDYDYPLVVVSVCSLCHSWLDRTV
jgi:hypothetical protein